MISPAFSTQTLSPMRTSLRSSSTKLCSDARLTVVPAKAEFLKPFQNTVLRQRQLGTITPCDLIQQRFDARALQFFGILALDHPRASVTRIDQHAVFLFF